VYILGDGELDLDDDTLALLDWSSLDSLAASE